jgi:hypothetical protein
MAATGAPTPLVHESPAVPEPRAVANLPIEMAREPQNA